MLYIRILLGLPLLPFFVAMQVLMIAVFVVISPLIFLMVLMDWTRGENYILHELAGMSTFLLTSWWEGVK